MLKITDAVRSIVRQSAHIYQALHDGHLNLSSYATEIQQQVEDITHKEVRKNTVVTALARMRAETKDESVLLPHVVVDDISVHGNLLEVAFEKTRNTLDALQRFTMNHAGCETFFLIAQGAAEITLIIPDRWEKELMSIFKSARPTVVVHGLASLTIHFSKKYMEEPNMFYALLSRFVMERLVIVEMVSTFTEISIIIHRRDIDRAFALLQGLLDKKK